MNYKVGDRVKIKSLDWYNRHTNGTEVDCGKYPFTSDMKEFCGQERIIANVCQECYFLLGIDDKFVFTDEMIEALVEEEMKSEDELLDEYEKLTDRAFKGGYEKCKSDIELNGFQLPDGYIFKDENGNIINAQKIVLEKKKKEYPKTYEECCEIMQVARPIIWFDYNDVSSISEEGDEYESHIENILCAFRKLRICRDAYWKIAGEEMGLGKPFEPDWDNLSTNHEFIKINKGCFTYSSRAFAFPTEEMRDAFKENFDPDIEICKELL